MKRIKDIKVVSAYDLSDEKLLVKSLADRLNNKHFLFKRLPRKIIGSVFFLFSASMISRFLPLALNQLIDSLNYGNKTPEEKILRSIIIYCSFNILYALCKSGFEVTNGILAEEISVACYSMYIDKLNRLSFLQRSERDISLDHFHIQSSANSIEKFIVTCTQTLTNFLEIIVNVNLIKLNKTTNTILVTYILFRLFIAQHQAIKLAELRKKLENDSINAADEIHKIINCHELIHTKGMLDQADKQVCDSLHNRVHSQNNFQKNILLYDSIKNILSFVCLGVIFICTNIEPNLIGFYIYLINFIDRNCENISIFMQTISETRSYIKKPIEILRIKPDIQEPNRSIILPSKRNFDIEFDNVSLNTPQRGIILNDVSFKISAGQTVAFVGASGSGKSMITKLIARLIVPTSGSIYIDNDPIESISLRSLRRSCAYLSQNPNIISATLAENIQYGSEQVSSERINQAVLNSKLGFFVEKLPQGINTRFDSFITSCSGGEKQRISLARELLDFKPIIILDEATSALDPDSEGEVIQKLLQFYQNATIIIVSHNLINIQKVDKIILVSDGRIEATGTHEELLEHSLKYHLLWEQQNCCKFKSSTNT